MLKKDYTELLDEWLYHTREPSGNLYPSMDLLGSLRHSMLRAAGAPLREEEGIAGLVRLETGTIWHDRFEMLLRRSQLPVMMEVRLTDYMPEGWSGRADWITWSDKYRAFVLGDLKTIKPEGMPYIRRDGIKDSHMWQLSSYWYALEKMGLPLVKAFHVLYLPFEQEKYELLEGVPLDRDLVLGTMVDRAAATRKYLAHVNAAKFKAFPAPEDPAFYFVNEFLAPVQEREQVARWNKDKSVFDVKLVPNWSANYCLYPPELCDCHTQGQTKIGEWRWLKDNGTETSLYVSRNGYEEIECEVQLTDAQIKKLKEANAGDDKTNTP
jgi:hypothetical protein